MSVREELLEMLREDIEIQADSSRGELVLQLVYTDPKAPGYQEPEVLSQYRVSSFMLEQALEEDSFI